LFILLLQKERGGKNKQGKMALRTLYPAERRSFRFLGKKQDLFVTGGKKRGEKKKKNKKKQTT